MNLNGQISEQTFFFENVIILNRIFALRSFRKIVVNICLSVLKFLQKLSTFNACLKVEKYV